MVERCTGNYSPIDNEWRLLQCNLNKDVNITDYAQITLPDIQLK